MRRSRSAFAVALFALALILSAPAALADRVLGNYLGTFAGNDSAASVSGDVGFILTQLARVDTPATSNDGLDLSNLSLNGDNEPVSGWWDYTGPGTVDYLVVKAGPNYAIYEYNDLISNNMANMGLWDTSGVDNKGMSHITAYSIVPEPGSAALLLAGTLGLLRRRRN